MKVQGVDPLVMNRIEEQSKKQAVHETKQALIADGQDREKEKHEEESINEEKLAAAVKKLNRTAEALQIGVVFNIAREDGRLWVFVLKRNTDEVIRRVPPGRVVNTLNEMETLAGFMVNRLL